MYSWIEPGLAVARGEQRKDSRAEELSALARE